MAAAVMEAASRSTGLHFGALPGAPVLTTAPLSGSKRSNQNVRGPFCLGGYVVRGYHPKELEDAAPVPEFALYWAELCGPNEHGLVGIYLYANHEPDAVHMHDYEIFSFNGSYKVVGNVLHEVDTPEYITFRTPNEAKLWYSAARSAASGGASGVQATKLREVVAEVEEWKRLQPAPREPLAPARMPTLRARVKPTDELAMQAHARRNAESDGVAAEVRAINERGVVVPPGAAQTGSFGTDTTFF